MSNPRINSVKFAIGSTTDAFGRLRSSQPQTIFDSKQINDKQPLFWDDQQTSGSGTTSTYNTNQASTTITVGGSDGTRVRQTFRRFNYQPGKSQLFMMTGRFRENIPMSLNIRTYTSGTAVDNKVQQNDWNIDKMDGTGPSGLILDLSKCEIFFCDYEWLGVGTAAVGVVINRELFYLHWFNHANDSTFVYMSTPNLPLRYEISKSGATITKRIGLFDGKNGIFFEQTNCSDSSLVHICSTVISEGGLQETGFPFGVNRGTTPLITLNNSNIYPLIAMRLNANYLTSAIRLLNFSINCTSTATFNYYLLLNPTVVGTAFSFSAVTNSSIEVDVSRTNSTTLTGGTILLTNATAQTNESGTNIVLNSDFNFGSTIAGVSDVVVLAVQRVTGVTETFYAGINWKDQQ